MQKQIYIVVSQTGTILSRFLKLVTSAEYNHVSISLVPDLQTMYSFGRRHPYNPFWGGFVVESPHAGTFKRFSETKVIVLSIAVSEEQYEAIRSKLNLMLSHRKTYHYNYLGLGLAAFHIYYRKAKHYYCSEFVKELLARFNVQGSEQLAPIVQPIHFLTLPYAQTIYCGKLREYPPSM